jgi:hypothetical protein
MLNPNAQIPSATTIRLQLLKRAQDIEEQLLVDLLLGGQDLTSFGLLDKS